MSVPDDWIVGVDEAGRGPLAGPVVVAAVVFDPTRPRINGLNDSKQLNAERREICIDFVVHGEHGVAGPWAASAG